MRAAGVCQALLTTRDGRKIITPKKSLCEETLNNKCPELPRHFPSRLLLADRGIVCHRTGITPVSHSIPN